MYRPVPLCDISQVVRTGTYYIIVQVGTGRYVPVRNDMYQVYRIPDGLFYLLVSVSFNSEDLKRLRALSPLGQKHAFWNRTGNLPIVQRNDLTTEPGPQI